MTAPEPPDLMAALRASIDAAKARRVEYERQAAEGGAPDPTPDVEPITDEQIAALRSTRAARPARLRALSARVQREDAELLARLDEAVRERDEAHARKAFDGHAAARNDEYLAVLEGRVAAALALHHDDGRGNCIRCWCTRYPACTDHSDGTPRHREPWPCDTVRALGVEA